MHAFVWIDSWQQQCCGDDFRVGSDVSWSVVPQDGPNEWVELLLDRPWAEKVVFHEEHHGGGLTTVIRCTVRSIHEVTYRLAPQVRGPDQILVPVPGSGIVKEVAIADKWGPEPPDDLKRQMSFGGWIVEVTQ
jgi:hypothetical protein